MDFKLLCIALGALTLCGCTDDNEFKEVPAVAAEGPIEIAFIGNSIVRHSPKAEVGWNGDWGMAASSLDNAYVYKVAAKAGVPKDAIYARSLYPFETDASSVRRLADSLEEAFNKTDSVVIHLGENVKFYNPIKLYQFSGNYDYLLSKVPEGKRLYCMSTFWEWKVKDYMIKNACERYNGTYVYIGDIYDSVLNVDRQSVKFEHAKVNAHPQDYGMNAIADRLLAHFPERKSES